MLSSRGAVLTAGAAAMAVTGLVYGVEEFVLLAVSVGVLVATGAVVVRFRQRAARRALHVLVRVPAPEVTAGQAALVEMRLVNQGHRRLPPVLVAEPRRHWSLSHPGMGELRRAPAARGPAPSRDLRLFDTEPRPSWRQRALTRRRAARSFRLPELARGADAVLWVPVPTGRRGLLTLTGVGVWCEDPFRLFVRHVIDAPAAHVVVYPAPTDASWPVMPARRTLRRGPRAATATRGSAGDELSGLRPYAPGDRLTRLHWPAMARNGDLVVRDFAEAEAGSLTVLLDVRPAIHLGASVDAAVARAAGIALGALASGRTITLCTSAGDRLQVDPAARGRQDLLRALALVGPATPGPAMMRRWGGRPTGGTVWATGGEPDGDVVLVTTATGEAQPALPEFLRGQAGVVVVT